MFICHLIAGFRSNVSDEMLNGPMRGWICGHFYPKESDFHRHEIEICVKTLSVGKSDKVRLSPLQF